MASRHLALLAATILIAFRAPAQMPGDTVRVTAPSLGLSKSLATFITRRDDTLYLKPFLDSIHATVIPVAAVTRFELQRDRSQLTTPEIVGGVSGMILGATFMTAVMEHNGYAVCGDCDVPDLGYYAALGGAVIGGLGGFVIGHSLNGSDYRPISLALGPPEQPRSERRAAVAISPTWIASARGPGLAFGLRF